MTFLSLSNTIDIIAIKTTIPNMNIERKIPPPLLALATAFMMYCLFNIGPQLPFFGTIKWIFIPMFITLGMILDGYSLWLFIRAKTTINPLKAGVAKVLITQGLYKYTRNPMYLGLVFFLISWGIYLNTVLSSMLIVIFIIYMNKYQIIPEEKELLSIFGAHYDTYKKTTRRWM